MAHGVLAGPGSRARQFESVVLAGLLVVTLVAAIGSHPTPEAPRMGLLADPAPLLREPHAPSSLGAVRGEVGAGLAPGGDRSAVVHAPAHPALDGPGRAPALAGPSAVATLPPGQVVRTIPVGSGPQAVAIDPVRNWVYVTNTAANTVTVLNGTSTVGTVSVGTYPSGVAYNPHNGLVYVADDSSDSVTVIAGTTVFSTILPVSSNPAAGPYAVAYNPSNWCMYVAEYGTTVVAVINGTTVTANITVPSAPDAVVYDPANMDIYVAAGGGGAGTVSVIHGTTVVDSISVGSGPEGLAYDDANGYVYATNVGSNTVSVIDTTNKVTATIPVGSQPIGVAFDSGNGYLYVADYGSKNVSVIDGTRAIGVVVTGVHTVGLVYDASNSCVYVTQQTQNVAVLISTGLVESPVYSTPSGTPLHSADLGQTVTFNTTVWYLGSGTPVAAGYLAPTTGLGCAAQVTFSYASGIGDLRWTCQPVNATGYIVELNVTNRAGLTVSSVVPFRVFPGLVTGAPEVSVGNRNGLTEADVGQAVNFSESASLGTGNYPAYRWETFPAGACSATDTLHPACVFAQAIPAPFELKVVVTDSNGVSATSPSVYLKVNPLPVASTPAASHPAADLGQAVDFSTTVTGGSGALAYTWGGLPSGCVGASGATPHCGITSLRNLTVNVQVTDAAGGASPKTGAVTVTVSPDPHVTSLTASASIVTVGFPVVLTAKAAGGWGNYTYNWSGLPPGCTGHSATIDCRPTQAGSFNVSVAVTDANGYRVLSTVVGLSVINPPSLSGGTIVGLAPPVFYGTVAALAVMVVAAAVFAWSRRQR